VPKEPRQRDNRGAKKSGDTVTRNIVIGMVALVVLSGVIFTVLDKRSGSETALPASIEKIDASIESLIRNKEANVTYHMTSFLGMESKRATNAAYCAADESRFIEFHKAIYAVQGAENSGIFSNKNLIEIGKRLGINSPTFESCVNDNKYGDNVEKVYASMAKNKVEGTPTVFINGKLWSRSGSEFVLDEFKAAVEAAKK